MLEEMNKVGVEFWARTGRISAKPRLSIFSPSPPLFLAPSALCWFKAELFGYTLFAA